MAILVSAALMFLVAWLGDYGVLLDALGPGKELAYEHAHFLVVRTTVQLYLGATSFLLITAVLLFFPGFVCSILQKSDMLERKILQKLLRKMPQESPSSPEEPPSSSLRNTRIVGLLCLSAWLALAYLMWTEKL